MKVLYFVGAPYCGICNTMLREAVEPLYNDFPDRIEEVDTGRYSRELARIERRGKVKRVPCVVIEDGGRETARLYGTRTEEELRALLA